MSDRAIPPHGNVVADDFVASSSTISTVCAWGIYSTRNNDYPDVQGDGDDCACAVTDDFRIRVYIDENGRVTGGPMVYLQEGLSEIGHATLGRRGGAGSACASARCPRSASRPGSSGSSPFGRTGPAAP